jgi:peptide/nickel transport system permease protein
MSEETKAAEQIDLASDAKEDVGELSQGQLMVRRFFQSKLSVFGGVVIIILYLAILFAGFLSPYHYNDQWQDGVWAPPTKVRFQSGKLGMYALKTVLNEKSFKFEFQEDTDDFVPVKLFVRTWPYKLLGFIPSRVHLFGIQREDTRLYILGADQLGRCMFARILQGGRISMTVGLLGVVITIVLGSIIGTASGYLGGAVDNLIQRTMELLASFPRIPLWAALAGALPRDMTIIQRYFLITIILSLIGWIGLARQVRGKVMAYRSNDYTSAARAAGAGNMYIILNHMLPNAASHIIVVAALSIPGMIGAETTLSFLGLGIQPPAVSWGSLLRIAQNVTAVLQHPWELTPAVGVIVAVAAFNFLGDGMRDAVDPYG